MKCLELARLSGTEPRPETWLQKYGQLHNEDVFSYLDISAKLDGSQCVRVSDVLFPDLIERHLRFMKYLCHLANESEAFYRCINVNQWLRTAISMEGFIDVFTRQAVCNEIDAKAITIQSNVVPSEAYLTRVENAMATCSTHQFIGFFPSTLLEEAVQEKQRIRDSSNSEHIGPSGLEVPFSAILVEWTKKIETCFLAKQMKERLQEGVNEDALPRVKFWFVELEDTEFVQELGSGSEGTVSEVLWRRGTFARKSFKQKTTFLKELDIALTVSHPNIVHCFGFGNVPCTDDPCSALYMEFLSDNLEYLLIERDRLSDGNEPPFSFQDSLDILLQISRAMEHLHEMSVVHGDLKPDNILMNCFDMTFSDVHYYLVKIADFGNAQRVTNFECQGGSHFHRAPEVHMWLQSKKTKLRFQFDDPLKIDVYSFGIIAYQVLTGTISLKLYNGKSHSETRRGVITGSLRPDFALIKGSLDRRRLSLLPLIWRCWSTKSKERPPFSEISATIQHLSTCVE